MHLNGSFLRLVRSPKLALRASVAIGRCPIPGGVVSCAPVGAQQPAAGARRGRPAGGRPRPRPSRSRGRRRARAPTFSNSSSISWFVASSVALNVAMPSSRARSASASISSVPTPRPCQSSATVTAASATRGRSARRTKRAIPTPSPADRVQRPDRLVVVVVDLGEVAQLRVGEARHRREEAPVARLGAQAVEALGEELSCRRGRTRRRMISEPSRSATLVAAAAVIRTAPRTSRGSARRRRALDLQRRRQLAGGLRQVVVEDRRSA